MDIKKFLPGQDRDAKQEYFWALVIEPGWIQAGIWRIQEEKTQVIFAGSTSAWELDEDLLSTADAALSAAIQNFPEDLKEPSKTVFGVSSSWVKSGQIKDGYLEKIKKLCSELSLTPVGFVVLPEAIAHLIKSEEGSPLNAVVLGVYKQNIEISVFKLGSLQGTTQVARSVSIADDVTEGLTRFGEIDSVPSRFILYDGKEGELEEARQALMKVNWDDFDKLKFLHTPKIETVDADRKIHAVSLAGASELADVTVVTSATAEQEKDEVVKEEVNKKAEPDEKIKPEELGFVREKDVAKQKTVPLQDEEVKQQIETDTETFEKDLPAESVENVVPVQPQAQKRNFPINASKITKGIGNVTGGISASAGSFLSKFKFMSAGRKPLVFGFVFLILLIVAGGLAWWYYPKAVVTIYVAPKRLEERVEIMVDPSVASPNYSEKILPGELLSASVTGEKTKSTTGTKTVGERAKGEVTLYRVGSALTLSSGTILYGPEDLKFSLDGAIEIASGSAGSPGTTNAQVTAEDIGAQYNLAGEATFSVGNYSTSDIEAKNESSFSGGSSREISAVSEEDQTQLEKDLKEELSDKAENDMLAGLSENKYFVEESITTTTSSKTFSDKVGDETSTLKLDLALDVQAFAVDEGELVELSGQILADKVPEGFVLRGDQLEVSFEFEEEDSGVYKFIARVEANLLPELDPVTIADKIVGKYPTLAEDYLTKEIPGFARAEIKLRPRLPGKLGTLPRVANNIEVEISAER
jgi:hypothetical protein